MPLSLRFNFEEKMLQLYFGLHEECPNLLGIDHQTRKTILLWNSSEKEKVHQDVTVCLVSTVLGTV